MRLPLALLSTFFCLWLNAQTYPKGYFGAPFDTTLYLSANFGAIRGNHFHSGIDLRTFGKEGIPVLAAADGYVVRIKISPYGYGKALYINHQNGYTTVYAHLQNFTEKIQQYTHKQQYAQKSFEIDLFVHRDTLPVKKGEIIAFSGNSGGSTGPHLHFEIRDTKTEDIIDPLLFQLPVTDTLAPRFANSFVVYAHNTAFKHKNGHYPYQIIQKKILAQRWGDTLKVPPGNYAFGTWADDYMTADNADVGVNYLQLLVNGKEQFFMKLQRFAFDETRMVNCHIDYNILKANGSKWHKCFIDDGNTLPIYTQQNTKFIAVAHAQAIPIVIKTFDIQGFADSIPFFIVGDTLQPQFMELHTQQSDGQGYIYPGQNFTHKEKNYSFTIPKGALYDTIALTTKSTPHKRKDLWAPYNSILKADIPLHKSFTITINPTLRKNINPDKWVVVRLLGKGLKIKVSEGGTYKNGKITATAKTFGIFSVAYDDEPPLIEKYKKTDSLITLKITDNLSGISSYTALLNGQWWLMEYDAKNDMLSGILPMLPFGKHNLQIIVTDERKNTQTFTQTITQP